ncbi:Lrp/AsnC family transcriptional regulator [Saccharopolyspora sp. NPDC002686]|uniref:Lrp/AsnC family transcriptional regulator n=1 Tax=Saccharopolyspora sp. NPDC002686 TaxID=3154541 RepID=UPI0033164F2C
MSSDGRPGLDALDRRIVAALQVDGRAPWRKIALALGEQERTVARRGAHLLAAGRVVITGTPARSRIVGAEPVILAARCLPMTVKAAAAALAHRPEVVFTYVTTGVADCVAELMCPPDRLSTLLLDELPGTPGLQQLLTYPITRYYSTVHDWRPGILSDAEIAALSDDGPQRSIDLAEEPARLDSASRTIVRALIEDGRRTNEELGRLAGVSEATARRKVDFLRKEGLLYFRAVVEPALLGLPVEALCWIRAAPDSVDRVGEELVESPLVRYAAAVAGPHQLLVDVTLPNRAALHEFTSSRSWGPSVQSIEASLVIHPLKRSSVMSGPEARTDLDQV